MLGMLLSHVKMISVLVFKSFEIKILFPTLFRYLIFKTLYHPFQKELLGSHHLSNFHKEKSYSIIV